MDKLNKNEVWELELRLFKHAAEHGVKPVACDCLGGLTTDQSNPAYWASYMPHTFLFQNPPSREDFWQLVAQTPWMDGIQKEYESIIAANDWPMIDFSVKAAHVYLKDDRGREVGQISVRRSTVYVNARYKAPLMSCDDIDAVCGRSHVLGHTSPAKDALRAAAHKIKEQFTKLPAEQQTEAGLHRLMREHLKSVGLKPRSRKHRITPEVIASSSGLATA